VRALAVVLMTALIAAGIGALTRAPYTPAGADAAVLRFSWRITIDARERCRVRTPQELESLPVHMRTPEVCEADEASYALVTRIDDARADTLVLLRGGVKGDRPLFVLEDRPLPQGRHRVRAELLRMNGATEPIVRPLDAELDFRAGAVRLVTLDPEARALTARE
jgi:hypothetical protein